MDAVKRRSSSLTSISSWGSQQEWKGVVEKKKGKILVITGGSGWLGSTIAKLAYNYWDDELREIRMFDVSPPHRQVISNITGLSSPPEGKPKISYHPGSIMQEDDLLACFAKADVVIHCAALIENGSLLLRKRMRSVNVGGTQKVIQACLECGVRALVFTGSSAQILQVDPSAGCVQYDETCQPTKQLVFAHYGGSKNEAENLVLLADGKEGREGVPLRTCSLRCPLMYGEGDKVNVTPILQGAKSLFGYLVPLGLMGRSNGVTMSSLYIGNGAWAHIVAARKLIGLREADESTRVEIASEVGFKVGGKFFYIGDHSPNCSLKNFYNQFVQPMGYKFLPFGIPLLLLKIVVFFLEFLQILLAFFHTDFRIVINRSTVRFFESSHSLSWGKAKRELGYAPLFSHQTAMARSMEYYRTAL